MSACINTISFTKSMGCLLLSKTWVQCRCAKILASHHDYAEKLSNTPTKRLFLRSRLVTAGSALCAGKWAPPQVWLTWALCSLLWLKITRSINSCSPGQLMIIAEVASSALRCEWGVHLLLSTSSRKEFTSPSWSSHCLHQKCNKNSLTCPMCLDS